MRLLLRVGSDLPDTVHLTKLAVGVPTLEEFEERIARRRERGEPMHVWTRSFPKRATEVVAAGSLYWVVAGSLAARQRVLAIEEDHYQDGSRCTRIDVETRLVRVRRASCGLRAPCARSAAR